MVVNIRGNEFIGSAEDTGTDTQEKNEYLDGVVFVELLELRESPRDVGVQERCADVVEVRHDGLERGGLGVSRSAEHNVCVGGIGEWG